MLYRGGVLFIVFLWIFNKLNCYDNPKSVKPVVLKFFIGLWISMKELSIVLVSGGMDSCVTAALANERYRLALLHVNYGQRTELRELKAFRDIASYYHVPEDRITYIKHRPP